MTGTLEESRDLSASLNNFKQISHSIDADNFEVSYNRHYSNQQGNRK